MGARSRALITLTCNIIVSCLCTMQQLDVFLFKERRCSGTELRFRFDIECKTQWAWLICFNESNAVGKSEGQVLCLPLTRLCCFEQRNRENGCQFVRCSFLHSRNHGALLHPRLKRCAAVVGHTLDTLSPFIFSPRALPEISSQQDAPIPASSALNDIAPIVILLSGSAFS